MMRTISQIGHNLHLNKKTNKIFGCDIKIPQNLILFCTTFSFLLLMMILAFISNEKTDSIVYAANRSVIKEEWQLICEEEKFVTTKDVSNISAIAFQSQNAIITVTNENENIIYHYAYDKIKSRLPEITWNVINIPKDTKSITLSIQTSDNACVLDVYSGYANDISSYILRTELFDTLICVVILSFGSILCIFHLIHTASSNVKRPTLFLGLLCITFFIMHISNTYIGQMFVKNNTLLYFLYYISVYLLPLFLCLHITDLTRISSIGFICTHFVMAIIIIASQFVSIYWDIKLPLPEISVTIYSWFVFIIVGYIICQAIFQLLDNNDYITTIALALLFVTIFGVIMSFCGVQYKMASFVTELSLLCSVFAVVFNEIKIFSATINESHNMEMYKKIALKDSLTGLGNRFAFMNAIGKLPLQNLCVVSFDINNLKYHNDTYGHQIGDKLLCDSAKVLSSIYGKNNVFRFGGDEFAACFSMSTPEEQEQLRNRLNDICDKFNAKSDKVKISIASGYAFGSKKDVSIDDIIDRADKEMYINKAFLKSNG